MFHAGLPSGCMYSAPHLETGPARPPARDVEPLCQPWSLMAMRTAQLQQCCPGHLVVNRRGGAAEAGRASCTRRRAAGRSLRASSRPGGTRNRCCVSRMLLGSAPHCIIFPCEGTEIAFVGAPSRRATYLQYSRGLGSGPRCLTRREIGRGCCIRLADRPVGDAPSCAENIARHALLARDRLWHRLNFLAYLSVHAVLCGTGSPVVLPKWLRSIQGFISGCSAFVADWLVSSTCVTFEGRRLLPRQFSYRFQQIILSAMFVDAGSLFLEKLRNQRNPIHNRSTQVGPWPAKQARDAQLQLSVGGAQGGVLPRGGGAAAAAGRGPCPGAAAAAGARLLEHDRPGAADHAAPSTLCDTTQGLPRLSRSLLTCTWTLRISCSWPAG